MDYMNLLGKKSETDASIWKRLLAFLIDLAVLEFIVFFPFNRLLRSAMPKNMGIKESYNFFLHSGPGSMMATLSIIISFIALLYFVLLEYKIGQTIGKIMLNLYVVGEEKEIKAWQAIVRSMFLIPLFPFMALWIIDPVYLAFIGKNKRLSEVLSKTKVVERR